MLLSGIEDTQGPEGSSIGRCLGTPLLLLGLWIDSRNPFLIRMQDACFYVWGLGARSSQRKTGDESGIGEHNGRASSTDVCVCYTASRSWSP